ncbi:MAG: DUF3822 family protein [Muribaculaceae bacterium]|nr:DUF3822 family protein [Muribaculaceae bacterium]
MDELKLDKSLVENPQDWRLSMTISEKKLEMVAYSLKEQNTLMHHLLPLADTSTSPIAALGDVVYDNTLLLSDFSVTDVLIDTSRFIIVPTEMATEAEESLILSTLWPGEKLTAISHPIVSTTDTLLAGVDSKVVSFVRRTFPTATVRHRLTPLLSYLITNDHEVGVTTMYVNVRDQRMDVIYFSERGLQAVNTYQTPTLDDMLYYIMTVAKGCDMNISKDEIVICGDASEADHLQSLVKKYVRTVLTMDPPYEVASLGTTALTAPLELTLLPLCV